MMSVENERIRDLDGLDAALSEIDRDENENYSSCSEAYDIYVKHGISFNKTRVYMTGENLLIQVYECAAKDLGFKSDSSKAVYVNEKTGKSTPDSEMNLNEFEIGPEDVLTIFPDGKVAAK